jgi:hypothetical protein
MQIIYRWRVLVCAEFRDGERGDVERLEMERVGM